MRDVYVIRGDVNYDAFELASPVIKFITHEDITGSTFAILDKNNITENKFASGIKFLSIYQNMEITDYLDWYKFSKSAVSVLASAIGYEFENESELNLFATILAIRTSTDAVAGFKKAEVLSDDIVSSILDIELNSDTRIWAMNQFCQFMISVMTSDDAVNLQVLFKVISTLNNIRDEFDTVDKKIENPLKGKEIMGYGITTSCVPDELRRNFIH